MSQSIIDFQRSGKAAADLSTKRYYIVVLDSSGNVALAASATGLIVGVLQNKPKQNEAALYRFLGTTKVIAGGTVNIGDWVTTDGNGKAITTTTDKNVAIGRALEAADSGDIIEVQMGIVTLSV